MGCRHRRGRLGRQLGPVRTVDRRARQRALHHHGRRDDRQLHAGSRRRRQAGDLLRRRPDL